MKKRIKKKQAMEQAATPANTEQATCSEGQPQAAPVNENTLCGPAFNHEPYPGYEAKHSKRRQDAYLAQYRQADIDKIEW